MADSDCPNCGHISDWNCQACIHDKRKPRTIGDLLQSLPDLREEHPSEAELIRRELAKLPKLSDQPTKEARRRAKIDLFFSISWALGACMVLFVWWPMLGMLMVVVTLLTFMLIVVE